MGIYLMGMGAATILNAIRFHLMIQKPFYKGYADGVRENIKIEEQRERLKELEEPNPEVIMMGDWHLGAEPSFVELENKLRSIMEWEGK